MITTIGFGLTNNLDAHSIIYSSCWGLAGGIISIFIVMGLLPIYEYIFKITTDITLLELSDLNHPLLKELTLKAPGPISIP
jgi:membrane-associated HD superfamily phosphohydrolase